MKLALIYFTIANLIAYGLFYLSILKGNKLKGEKRVGHALSGLGIKFILLLVSFIVYELKFSFSNKMDLIAFFIPYIVFGIITIKLVSKLK